jgi:hypothetical protein
MTAEYFEQDAPPGLAPGVYTATLTAIEDVVVRPYAEAEKPDDGTRWQFTWDVDIPSELEPTMLKQLTSRKLNDFPTTAWKILTALGYKGGKVARSDFIGRRCMLTLGLKPSGWNSFEAYSPIPAPITTPVKVINRNTLNLKADFPTAPAAAAVATAEPEFPDGLLEELDSDEPA